MLRSTRWELLSSGHCPRASVTEVGFAHGIKKPTILLSDRARDKLPFDISAIRTIFYDNTIRGKKNVDERLRKHLEAISADSLTQSGGLLGPRLGT